MRVPTMLLADWTAAAVRPQPPASGPQVAAAFAKLGTQATQDVVALYEQVGGMEIPDNNEWRLWPLDELIRENMGTRNGLVAFSDYLIGCWNFYLEPVNLSISRVLTNFGDGPLVEAAPSLEAFVASLAYSPLKVLDPLALLHKAKRNDA